MAFYSRTLIKIERCIDKDLKHDLIAMSHLAKHQKGFLSHQRQLGERTVAHFPLFRILRGKHYS